MNMFEGFFKYLLSLSDQELQKLIDEKQIGITEVEYQGVPIIKDKRSKKKFRLNNP